MSITQNQFIQVTRGISICYTSRPAQSDTDMILDKNLKPAEQANKSGVSLGAAGALGCNKRVATAF